MFEYSVCVFYKAFVLLLCVTRILTTDCFQCSVESDTPLSSRTPVDVFTGV